MNLSIHLLFYLVWLWCSTRHWDCSELPPSCDLPEDQVENTHTNTHTHIESLTEVQCIVMKIKDTLITAAKWYWTSVNAGEGTSKCEDSWTSHKMESLSACAWGCKWGTRAPDGRTRNGPTLPRTRWLHREKGTSSSHIRPTTPQLLCSTPGSTPWGISIRLGSI